MRLVLSCLTALALVGCTTTPEEKLYNSPEDDGLIAVGPYPNPDDVCQVIGENALTNQYLDDSATLIGCPSHETGAIADRQAEGGEVLDLIGSWLLLSMPNR